MSILSWRERALCAETDPDLFFPEKGESTLKAKFVCLRCPVRDDCLAYALDDPSLVGVWGGTSVVERRRIREREAA